MKGLKLFFCLILLAGLQGARAQALETKPPKIYQTQRCSGKMTIDGQLNEPDWQRVGSAEDFVQLSPHAGEASCQRSSVRLLYSDDAIYIGAYLYDIRPDSIYRQLSKRDQVDNADWFGVLVGPYHDGQNGNGFTVTAAGVQLDQKRQVNGADGTWDGVWKSAISFPGDGWIVEMEIPYAALRFPTREIQEWEINFGRNVRRYREESWWNPINPLVSGILNQSGLLQGIEHIRSPLRLSLNPYFSSYLQYDQAPGKPASWSNSVNGGLDIKYGINDAFTIDMTLIPDFGQVRFDDQVLNLSPFEVRFDENRPFFTEGTELFNKGDLFYSRRIGSEPFNLGTADYDLQEGEEIASFPLRNKLINATKLSGRTRSGLGIGVFNAVEARSYANIRQVESGAQRQVEINPLTNYSVLVLDQNLKNNSSVTLLNTNVTRFGKTYDANVTSGQFNIRDRSNQYYTSGVLNISRRMPDQGKATTGHQVGIDLGKNSGTITYSARYFESSPDYDHNDMGFLSYTNYREFRTGAVYSNYKPSRHFNQFKISLDYLYNRLYKPDHFTSTRLISELFAMTRTFQAFGYYANWDMVEGYDYFEPRRPDYSRYYKAPRQGFFYPWISTDYSRPFAFDLGYSLEWFDESGRNSQAFNVSPRYRFSDRFSMILFQEWTWRHKNVGYISAQPSSLGYEQVAPGDILFGRRDMQVVESELSAEYTFNNKMALSLLARHYWNRVKYLDFHLLDSLGGLAPTPYQGLNAEQRRLHDIDFNILNIDLIFSWRFAPGSDLFLAWKQNIFETSGILRQDYIHAFSGLFRQAQSGNLSLRVVYYLDYQMLEARLRKDKPRRGMS